MHWGCINRFFSYGVRLAMFLSFDYKRIIAIFIYVMICRIGRAILISKCEGSGRFWRDILCWWAGRECNVCSWPRGSCYSGFVQWGLKNFIKKFWFGVWNEYGIIRGECRRVYKRQVIDRKLRLNWAKSNAMNALGAVGSYFANNVVIVSEYFLDSV